MLKVALVVAIALVAAIVLTCAGCARAPSPLNEMMALTAQGHVACVRQGVLVRGRSCSQ